MRIQKQAESFAYRVAISPSDLHEYRTERHRQEVEREGLTGGYGADEAHFNAQGGKPLITLKDWMKGQKGRNVNPGPPATHEVYTPDEQAWGTAGEAPPW